MSQEPNKVLFVLRMFLPGSFFQTTKEKHSGFQKVISYNVGVSADPRSVVFCLSKRPGIHKKLTLSRG